MRAERILSQHPRRGHTPTDNAGRLERSITLAATSYKLTTLGVLSLVALRLAIGWHFFREGVGKFRGEGFSARTFLDSAVGPLAGWYHSLLPDRFGQQQLSKEHVVRQWEQYLTDAADHFGFTDPQRQEAKQKMDRRKKQLESYFDEHKEEIREYLLEVARYEHQVADPTVAIEFQQERAVAKRAELRRKSARWLADLQLLSQSLRDDLHQIATAQQQQYGDVPLPNPDFLIVDPLVKYGILVIGIGLLVGLFTRICAAAAALFLLSVILSQPPWMTGAQTMFLYYQIVEVMALLVVMTVPGSRLTGVDYFVHAVLKRCCPPRGQAGEH